MPSPLVTHISPAKEKNKKNPEIDCLKSKTHLHLPGHASEIIFHTNLDQLIPRQELNLVVPLPWHLQHFTPVYSGCPINHYFWGSGPSPYRGIKWKLFHFNKMKVHWATWTVGKQISGQIATPTTRDLANFSAPARVVVYTSQLAHRWAWHISSTLKQELKLGSNTLKISISKPSQSWDGKGSTESIWLGSCM